MDDQKKLIDLMLEDIERFTGTCFICEKMGYKCKVGIPENADTSFQPDFDKCDFRSNVYKTLTIEH